MYIGSHAPVGDDQLYMLHFVKQHKPTFLIVLLLIVGLFTNWQSFTISCKELKNGQFHFYGKQSSVHYLIIRQDSIQKEVNLATKDTSCWKVGWIDECTYTANYLSGGMKSEEEQNFLRSHITIIQIQKATRDFYIIKGSLDSLNSKMSMVDTVWRKPK